MPSAPLPRFTRRRWLLAAGASLALGARGHAAAPPDGRLPGLRFIGEATLPHRMRFGGTTVGGLSGLDYDPGQDLWIAISDDPRDARFYSLRLPVRRDGLGPPELLGVTHLDAPDHPDAESIRWRPGAGTVLWSTEGDVRRGIPPGLHESTRDGRLIRDFVLPAHFALDADGRRGPRHNLAFEGLALAAPPLPATAGAWGSAASGNHRAWLAMENALVQDGPEPTVQNAGGSCRFTLFDLDSGQAIAQRAYVPEPIAQAPRLPGLFADNGVSEILMLDATRMLVLERSYTVGLGNTLRLFLADLDTGDDTLAMAALMSGQFRPVTKTLVADLSMFLASPGRAGLSRLDNTESLAWGPLLPAANGERATRTLVMLSDDNFNPLQVTQFVAFALKEPL